MFFSLTVDLYCFFAAVTTQIFIPTAELSIFGGISIKEAKAEMEAHPVTEEAKISKC